LIILGLGAAVVFFTSLLIVQRMARPLAIAAQRAESFRGAGDFDPLPEQGPEELVVLARNFNTMAREISEMIANRTTLLAGISHDLRTPLTRMRLALELLPENVDPNLLARLERNLESMDELIGDALRFARGAQEPAQQVEMRSFVGEVLRSFEPAVPLECAVLRDAPIDIAPGAFRRVLMNLVTNALQHGKDVRVRLEDRAVRVLDAGPGVPPELRERVFQPFYRLDSSRSAATGGSGLGLAIVQQLCQAHGWRVVIGDGPKGGTEVVVTF
jgi:two-component system osmolarity sensor histidine kinase EnvZ